MLKFVCPLIIVDDIERSRRFYELLLGQRVEFDFGQDVQFEGGFRIHLASHFQSLLGDTAHHPVTHKTSWGELYFQTDELEPVCQRLQEAGVEFIHPIHEQSWGQRAMRLYDPDGHIVEIGESMVAVVWRFYGQGLSIDSISQKSSMPVEFVERVIQEGRPGQAGCR